VVSKSKEAKLFLSMPERHMGECR